MRLSRLFVQAICLAGFALGACTGDNPPDPVARSVRVLLTDAPFPYGDVARVDVHVSSVVLESGASAGFALDTIARPNRAYNLLELTDGRTADLGEALVSPGRYEVILEIDHARSTITLKDGTVLRSASPPVTIRWLLYSSSAPTEEFLPVRASAPVDVVQGGGDLVVDFNLGRSFQHLYPGDPSRGFRFVSSLVDGGTPGVRAVDRARTGTVVGSVTGADGGPAADAAVELFTSGPADPNDERRWVIAGSARTDASGNFRISFVSPGTYSLRVDAPLRSANGGARREGVAVSVGAEASVGTVTLPRAPEPSTIAGTYVVRRVGPPEVARPMPATIAPAPPAQPVQFTVLMADTLFLESSGSGREVRVERHVDNTTPTPDVRTVVTVTPLTYAVDGRIVRLTYPCPGERCAAAPVGLLDGEWLTVYLLPQADPIGYAWPRAFERVAP